MKRQVVFINGWWPKENFESYHDMLKGVKYNPYEESFLNWNKTLWKKLWDDFEYLRTPLHDKDFADYRAWKIMFEKMFPYLRDDIIIVTTSLGSTFLLKYIWENDLPVRIKKLFFIAPAISDTPDAKLGSFAFDLDLVYSRVQRWAEKIFIYHSRDDDCVPFEQWLELHSYFPESVFREFHNRGHFYKQELLPELIDDIKN
jgi:predicted alpha/beta hydrolase family esterase